MKIFSVFLFILASAIFSCSSCVSAGFSRQQSVNPLNFILGNENLGPLNDGILGEAQAPGPAYNEPKVPLILAGNRTKRPDILRKFKIYRGGWDISNKHYWASVAFTGIAGFIITLVWLFFFGIMLLVHHGFGWRITFKGKASPVFHKIRLVLLVLFSCASMVGCILLSVGQLKLHGEASHTLKYVVNQSGYTSEMLRNVSDYLSNAKSIHVPQFELAQTTMQEIDELSTRLGSSADTIHEKTDTNSRKVRKVFNTVRSALITVASVMLVLAFFGLVLSLLGLQNVIHIFIFSGWLLVAVTVTLCGTFMIFKSLKFDGMNMLFGSAVSDSCIAMQEWVDNPRGETALSNILPCVDERTTNQTLYDSRNVVSKVVETVNTYIYTAANTDRPPSDQFYYNQSGPLVPPLCFPFDDKMHDRNCSSQEVSMTNASAVWAKYICTTSMDSINCTSTGRLPSQVYSQLVLAANTSDAVLHYTPAMLDLQNCNLLRDIFMTITSRYCPPLEHYLLIVTIGLGFISAGIMLCLILWFIYANRPQREEAFVKTSSINGINNQLDDQCEIKDGHATMVSYVVASPARIVPDIEK